MEDRRLGLVLTEQEFQFGESAHGPDIGFIGLAKEHLIDDDRRVQPFVPDLAVEVVSKNDTFGSVVKKAHRYLQYGTQEVWVFSIASREVYFYSPERDRILREHELFESALIPGFQIRLAELFDRRSKPARI